MEYEDFISKAAEWLYNNLPLDMSNEDKQWWINDFIEYMNS